MSERGFALPLVLGTFLLIGVIGLGAFSVVLGDTHGAVAYQLAMQATSVAEAGVNFAVAQLVARASDATPSDGAYRGESGDLSLPGSGDSLAGTFHVVVRCAYPSAGLPPACADDAQTAAIDERDLRVITSTGFVPARPGRARRQIEVTVQRHVAASGGASVAGICGREGVELGPETTVTADVASNGDVVIDGPQRNPGTVSARTPRAPAFGAAVETVTPGGNAAGLTGTYTWRVTFLTLRGEESGGSPPTPPVVLAGQHGRLTNIPVGDETIARRRIYRTPQGSPRGPWFLVGEIYDNVTQAFTDMLPDEALTHRPRGGIEGAVTAGGSVRCSRGCRSQIDGQVRSYVREVVCPNFLPPPVSSGTQPAPNPIVQSSVRQTLRWSSLLVGENGELTIETLSVPDAEVHIHVNDLRLDRGATLAVTGEGTVYLHVSRTLTLGADAVLGALDYTGRLIRPADRIQVLVSARDPSWQEIGIASVRLTRDNRVSAVIFAPNANIVIDRAATFYGALYGKHVRITRSSGFVLDPTEGLASERTGIRPSPYQYVVRWYDNPSPGP